MTQSLQFRGYRVSGAAEPWAGKWNTFYEVEKEAEPVRRCSFVLSHCSQTVAENTALIRGVAFVNDLLDDPR